MERIEIVRSRVTSIKIGYGHVTFAVDSAGDFGVSTPGDTNYFGKAEAMEFLKALTEMIEDMPG